jgi:hypothetical protein
MAGINLAQIMIRWRNDINNLRRCPCAISNIILIFTQEEILLFLSRKKLQCFRNNYLYVYVYVCAMCNEIRFFLRRDNAVILKKQFISLTVG